MSQNTKKILRLLLIALFVSYYCGSTLFYHTHVFEWGKVAHSHLFSTKTAHNHSTDEYQTISQLTTILIVAIELSVFIFFIELLRRLIEVRFFSKILILNVYSPLRAPPASYNL